MNLVEAVRLRGGFAGLADEELVALTDRAQALVRSDLERLGLALPEDEVTELVVLRACALASKRERTPQRESVGGAGVDYEPLSWDLEYAKALARFGRGRANYGGGIL